MALSKVRMSRVITNPKCIPSTCSCLASVVSHQKAKFDRCFGYASATGPSVKVAVHEEGF